MSPLNEAFALTKEETSIIFVIVAVVDAEAFACPMTDIISLRLAEVVPMPFTEASTFTPLRMYES
jgi:hypothetical protein